MRLSKIEYENGKYANDFPPVWIWPFNPKLKMHCTYAHVQVNRTLIQSQTIDFQEKRSERGREREQKRVADYGQAKGNNVSLEWRKCSVFVCYLRLTRFVCL